MKTGDALSKILEGESIRYTVGEIQVQTKRFIVDTISEAWRTIWKMTNMMKNEGFGTEFINDFKKKAEEIAKINGKLEKLV